MGGFTSNLNWVVPYPKGVFTAKMVNFRPAIIKLRMRENDIFLVPVKYTLVCRAPTLAVFGRTTHYRIRGNHSCRCSLFDIMYNELYIIYQLI